MIHLLGRQSSHWHSKISGDGPLHSPRTCTQEAMGKGSGIDIMHAFVMKDPRVHP